MRKDIVWRGQLSPNVIIIKRNIIERKFLGKELIPFDAWTKLQYLGYNENQALTYINKWSTLNGRREFNLAEIKSTQYSGGIK
jgi:hypothetical protein